MEILSKCTYKKCSNIAKYECKCSSGHLFCETDLHNSCLYKPFMSHQVESLFCNIKEETIDDLRKNLSKTLRVIMKDTAKLKERILERLKSIICEIERVHTEYFKRLMKEYKGIISFLDYARKSKRVQIKTRNAKVNKITEKLKNEEQIQDEFLLSLYQDEFADLDKTYSALLEKYHGQRENEFRFDHESQNRLRNPNLQLLSNLQANILKSRDTYTDYFRNVPMLLNGGQRSLEKWQNVYSIEIPMQNALNLQISPNFRYIAVETQGQICIFSLKTGSEYGRIPIESSVFAWLSPKRIVIARDTGQLEIWKSRGSQVSTNLESRTKIIYIAVSGNLLASVGQDHKIHMRQLPGLERIKTFDYHTNEVIVVAFSPSHELIASVGKDSIIKVGHCRGGGTLKNFIGHRDIVNDLSLTDNLLASGSNDKTVRLWSIDEETLIWRSQIQNSSIVSLVFSSPTGMYLFTSDRDGIVTVWQENEVVQLIEEKAHKLWYSDRKNELAIVGANSNIMLYSEI